jgi:hypothetical protein
LKASQSVRNVVKIDCAVSGEFAVVSEGELDSHQRALLPTAVRHNRKMA